MNDRTVSEKLPARSLGIAKRWVWSAVLIGCSPALRAQTPGATNSAPSVIRGTHILGFEKVSNNANGTLSVEGDSLQFQKTGGPPAKVSLASIQDVFLGVQSKQVGGAPLAVGRAAVPFGGGRAIALFSHKQYDTITLEYLDANGGYHGAIFELTKGQGETLKNQLVAGGVHVSPAEDPVAKPSAPEAKNEKK